MNISEVHLKKIARDVLLKVLREGRIPSAEELVRLIKVEVGDLEVSQSVLSQSDCNISYGEEASAKKFNKICSDTISDLEVLYNSYAHIETSFSDADERTLLELDRISRKTKSLISRANRLLLTTENTAGLLNTLGDDFTDSSLIDLTLTNSFLDLTGHSVHSRYVLTSDLRATSPVDSTLLTEADFKVTPLNPRARRTPGTRNSSVLDILSSSSQPWLYTITTDTQEQTGIEIRIDLTRAVSESATRLKINKLILDPFVTNNSVTTVIQTSLDGETWHDLPVIDPIRRLASPTTYLVNSLELRYIRLVMSKDTHSRLDQRGKFVWDFGIRSLILSDVRNVYEPESVLISKPFTIEDTAGRRKQFSKAALSVACEHKELGTNIDYYIAFLDESLTQGEFQKISPLNREGDLGPKIVETGSLSSSSVESYIDTDPPAFPGDLESTSYLLDVIPTQESINVWRNIGDRRRFLSIRQPDSRVVEEGWAFDGRTYNSYIEIDQRGGQVIDFGPSAIQIDGVSLTGRVRLSEGVHFIKVQPINWISLKGLRAVVSFEDLTKQFKGSRAYYGELGLDDEVIEEGNYRIIDPLYPYNHKLLIEGLHYSDTFEEQVVAQRYKGVAKFASFLMKRRAIHEVDSRDFSAYSIIRADDGEGTVSNRILVKWNGLASGEPREKFLVQEKQVVIAEGLVFKAVFTTTNPRLSSSLDGYEIKIAE